MHASRKSSPSAEPTLWIVILAGGIGSRFWPVSTPSRPKQLLPLASDRPLIVDTVERARTLVDDARLRILAGEHLMRPFREALPDLPEDSYLVEPRARGTCPVLAWAAWEIARQDPGAVMVSLHADHIIRPLDAFGETVRAAAALAAREELLLTVGVTPDRIETGFGHIQLGDGLDGPGGIRGYRVRAFHEKPDAETAHRYMEEGYLWNTGIFVWKASVFLDQVQRHAPEVAEHMPLLESGDAEPFFGTVPRCVVDTAVLERSDRVGCVRATFAWDDVGSWEALARTRDADEAGNVILGRGEVRDGGGNVVVADEGRVVLWGMDDVVAVRTGDTTLVMPKGRAAHLKKLLGELGEAT